MNIEKIYLIDCQQFSAGVTVLISPKTPIMIIRSVSIYLALNVTKT